jgi:hypothetical protein
MSAVSQKFNLMTFLVSTSVTSSPGSASGATLCAKPDGPTTGPSGREVALASRSAPQASKKALLTSVISGPLGSISSASAALQLSLVNRLQARSTGSILYRLTWKARTTPLGRQICALRASAARTSGNDFTGWVTAASRDWKDTPGMSLTGGGGRNRVDQLPRQAHLSGWPNGLGDADSARTQIGVPEPSKRQSGDTEVNDNRSDRLFRSGKGRLKFGGLANPSDQRHEWNSQNGWQTQRRLEHTGGNGDDRPHAPMLGRNAADWLYCRDGKWRPVEPGTFPLVDAATSRVGRLRAYGNGLDAETATQFVGAVMDCAP